MRKYLTLFLTFLTATLFAQGITTTAIKAQYLKNDSGKDMLLFSEGDTVIIHAFKKKKDKYFFIIETEMFAKKVSSPSIPFSVEEKKLKKLPDALSKEMKDFLLQKKEEVALRMKKKYRRPALDGEFRALLKNYIAFTGGYIGFPNKGDSVTLLGYKKEENRQCYALYNDNCAGVYCSNDSPDYLFDTDIDVQYLPSVEDPEVLKALEKGEQMVKQNMADNKARFRKRALSGNIKVATNSRIFESIEDRNDRFPGGDSLVLIGCSKVGGTYYYALCYEDHIGVYKASRSPSAVFKNLDFDLLDLPPYNSPEVKGVLQQRRKAADSLFAVKNLPTYMEHQPFLVDDISLDINTAGGVTVHLVFNNRSQQTVKYVKFRGYFLNAVGDKCSDFINGGSVWTATAVGPIGPCPSTIENCTERMKSCWGSYSYECLFYSWTAETLKLSSVTVQYTNGKSITLTGANLQQHVRYRVSK